MRRILQLLLGIAFAHVAQASQPASQENGQEIVFYGFNLNNEVINPACVKLLQPWLSENTSIIVRSVILETCQESNLASKGQEYVARDDGTIGYYEDPEDGHTYFSYQPLGKTDHDEFVLFHGGYLGLYRIDEETVTFDYLANERKRIHVLTRLSASWVPCFSHAEIDGDKIIIHKRAWNPGAPRSEQCSDDEMQQIEYSF